MSWSKWHWYDAVDDWNWEGFEGKPLLVSAYSSCEEVELFLNGKSLGRKKCGRETEYMAEWQVPFTPGELKAVGYSGNIKVSESVLRTAGEVSSMKISADRTRIISNGQDLSYVTIELTDSRGTRNPKAGKLLRFEVSGPGTIAGVGNSDPVSLESYTLPQRRTWKGRALVILKSSRVPGDIKLKVSSEGLPVGEIVIESGGK
jgi:beta-galactosidase